MKAAAIMAIAQATELDTFRRFRAEHPLTEAQLEASDRAYAQAKDSGTLAREQDRLALQRALNDGSAS